MMAQHDVVCPVETAVKGPRRLALCRLERGVGESQPTISSSKSRAGDKDGEEWPTERVERGIGSRVSNSEHVHDERDPLEWWIRHMRH
jgi:hypothetical protein